MVLGFSVQILPRTGHVRPCIARSAAKWFRLQALFLLLSGTVEDNGRYNWADVRIIGELKQSDNAKKRTDEFISFCGHAREVFASQPTRRFLHGFFIR